MNNYTDIDFVITWVDGADCKWQKEKAAYKPEGEADDRPERYRDWEIMQFWFRGIEKYAPWVRKVHFVTWGHVPPWLNLKHPKLHIVNHKDFIPEEYLPTFNTNAIELNLHRIPGLSEHFIYFNDDFFLVNDVRPDDFFIDGKPRDMLAFQPIVANPKNEVMSHMYLNNTLALGRHFNKRGNVKKQPGKYFHIGYPPLYFFYNLLELFFPLYTGFYTVHDAYVFCKSTFTDVWEKEGKVLHDTSCHRFRSSEDVTLYLFREWQKLTGNFVPKNITGRFGYYNLGQNNEKLFKDIRKQHHKIICINDANEQIDFVSIKKELQDAFGSILPEKSSFEIV